MNENEQRCDPEKEVNVIGLRRNRDGNEKTWMFNFYMSLYEERGMKEAVTCATLHLW